MEFNEHINMTFAELEERLKEDRSEDWGWKKETDLSALLSMKGKPKQERKPKYMISCDQTVAAI